MPQFDGDVASLNAVSPPLDPGIYTFQLDEPQVFSRLNRKNEESYGIKFPLRVVDGEKKGHLIFFDCYFNGEAGGSAAKRLAMAVMGFEVNESNEKKFNAQFGSDKESMHIDFEEKELGSFWKSLGGRNVVGSLGTKMNSFEGEEKLQQQYKKWTPYGAA